MILAGASLYRKLKHPPNDARHFLAKHETYKIEEGAQQADETIAEVFEGHVLKAAKLAACFLCQSSGGAAVQGA
eukprot:7257034-Pyramimonas_sp.AAC.1